MGQLATPATANGLRPNQLCTRTLLGALSIRVEVTVRVASPSPPLPRVEGDQWRDRERGSSVGAGRLEILKRQTFCRHILNASEHTYEEHRRKHVRQIDFWSCGMKKTRFVSN